MNISPLLLIMCFQEENRATLKARLFVNGKVIKRGCPTSKNVKTRFLWLKSDLERECERFVNHTTSTTLVR